MKLDSVTEYEIKAEAFRICTGHMAPGKDPASASSPAPFEERSAAWDAWMNENGRVVRAMLLDMARVLPDEE